MARLTPNHRSQIADAALIRPEKGMPMSQSGQSLSCVAFMPDDIEAFIECRGIEVRRDFVEISLRCPFRARRESKLLAPLLQLTLTEFVRCHDEVKLVVGPRHFDQLPKPGSLPLCVGRKVEEDRNPLRQQCNDVRREDALESGRLLHESREIDQFTGIKGPQ